jgi:hypothetical protein
LAAIEPARDLFFQESLISVANIAQSSAPTSDLA